MLIDLLFVILLVLAVIKGFQRGLIVGIFSFVAILVGLAAAIKLSAVVAGYIGESVRISDQWLPVISFAVVFIAVVLLVRLGANLLEKTVEIGMLGWLNRLGVFCFMQPCLPLYTVCCCFMQQNCSCFRRQLLNVLLHTPTFSHGVRGW